jgi:cyclic pyranopterin phosphate synthase
LNVSLDALDPALYARLTRRAALDAVLEGLRVARSLGFCPIKINAVLQRSANLGEVLPLVRFARAEGFVLRFIEYMPIGAGQRWRDREVVSNAELLETLRTLGELEPIEEPRGASPAQRWRWVDGGGEVGLIGSVTEPFCDRCNRIRITADGKLRTCLFSVVEHDIRGALRSGVPDARIAEIVRAAVARKEPGHRIGRADFVKPARTMSAIGG